MGNESTRVLRQEVLNELVKTTSFSEQDIRRFYREFSEICHRNRHLTVNCKHLENFYGQAFSGDAGRFSQHIFRVMDEDSNNEVDFREFITALAVHFQGTTERKLQWMFSLFDLDRNGHITMNELVELIESLTELLNDDDPFGENLTPQALAAKIFSEVDFNADDQISVSEFTYGARCNDLMNHLLQEFLRVVTQPFTSYMKNVANIRPRRISRYSMNNAKRRTSRNYSVDSHGSVENLPKRISETSQEGEGVAMETDAPRRRPRTTMDTSAPRRLRSISHTDRHHHVAPLPFERFQQVRSTSLSEDNIRRMSKF